MKLSNLLPILSSILVIPDTPLQTPDSSSLESRADSSLVGYLGAFFLGDKPYVYFDLSNSNNATSFKPLNSGNPLLIPTVGTGGVRDPSIIVGAGPDLGKKRYIIGTDLDIAKTTWDASQRTGFQRHLRMRKHGSHQLDWRTSCCRQRDYSWYGVGS
jgi:hypothetical protein